MAPDRIRVAFVKYAGLINGGGERLLIRLGSALDKSRFEVTYFWCHPGPEVPLSTNTKLQERLHAAGVRTVEFRVGRRDLRDPILPWVDTDFFEVFRAKDFDIVQRLSSGNPEFPFMYIPRPVVEWNLFGGVDHSLNTVRTICNCPWLLERWRANGGDPRKGLAGFPSVEPSMTRDSLRAELGIPAAAIVAGLHQRADETIVSGIPLAAFQRVAARTGMDLRFVILGGADGYRRQAEALGLDVIFVPETTEWPQICRFLNTLDIYAHGRRDGEVHSTAIAEAMLHGLPVVSHTSLVNDFNAHVEQVAGCGKVCDTLEEYEEFLSTLVMDPDLRTQLGAVGKTRAEAEYTLPAIARRVEAVYTEVYEKFCTPEFLRRLEGLPRSRAWWRQARTAQRRVAFTALDPIRRFYLELPEPVLAAVRPLRRRWRGLKAW